MINYDGSKELTYDFPRDFQVKQNGKVFPFYKLANNRIRFTNELPMAGDIDIVEVIKSQAQKPSFGHTLADMAFITHDDVDRIDDTAHRLDATEKQAQETLKVTQELLSETASYENANKQAITTLSEETQKSFDVMVQNIKANQDSTNNLIEGAVIKAQNETGAVADRLNKHELATNPHGINKKMLGIEKVDNTSDMDKPVSKATQEALDLKADQVDVEELQKKVEDQAKNQKQMIDGLASFGAGMTDPLPSQKGKKGKYLKTDGKKTYWADASGGGGGAVDSVNGQTGEVVLNASDVGAVASNEAITAGTYTKITYDTKGLVTGGSTLETSDIPDLSATYQPLLVSGTNIKTINNESLLGSGDITITSDIHLTDIATAGNNITFTTSTIDDYTVAGTDVTVTSGIASGFSSSSYLYKSISVWNTAITGSFTFQTKFKLSATGSADYENVFFCVRSNPYASGSDVFTFNISRINRIRFNGYDVDGTTISSNVDYWLRVVYNGSAISIQLSTDGTNFTELKTEAWSFSSSIANDMFIGISDKNSGTYFNGSIDLTETWFKDGDGNVIWVASSLSGLQHINAVLPNTTVTLASANWSSNTQTVTVSGMTSSKVVWISPAPTSASDYASGGVLCTAQGTNSLTFTCDTTPTNDISVNVVYA